MTAKSPTLLLPFINLGHALDHLVMLIFPTVVLALSRDLNRPYAELLPLSLGGFIAFGVLGLPAGWRGGADAGVETGFQGRAVSQQMGLHGHVACLAGRRRLQHVEHRGMRPQFVERDRQVFRRLVVDFELHLRDLVAATTLAGFLKRKDAQHVADAGKSARAETDSGAQQPACAA